MVTPNHPAEGVLASHNCDLGLNSGLISGSTVTLGLDLPGHSLFPGMFGLTP